MLRLLPESLAVGLFPGQCWMRRGDADLVPPASQRQSADAGELLATLAAMLDAHAAGLRKGTVLDLTVSDSLAMQVMLPWQQELISPEELLSYAHACFERQGVEVQDTFTVHTVFRHYRASGLAYAVQTSWLRDLLALLEARGFRLGSVLPVSAAVYWRHRGPPVAGTQTVVLLQEMSRVTAMAFVGKRLQSFDVEPVISDSTITGTRLLRRLGASYSDVNSVALWTPSASAQPAMASVVADCLPQAELRVLSRDCWN